MFLNRHDIEEACYRLNPETVAGHAARLLRAYQEDVDAHSDGWPYWSAPVKAARRLQELVRAHLYAGMGAYPTVKAATTADLQRALSPMRRFMTTRGKAAGMTVDLTL